MVCDSCRRAWRDPAAYKPGRRKWILAIVLPHGGSWLLRIDESRQNIEEIDGTFFKPENSITATWALNTPLQIEAWMHMRGEIGVKSAADCAPLTKGGPTTAGRLQVGTDQMAPTRALHSPPIFPRQRSPHLTWYRRCKAKVQRFHKGKWILRHISLYVLLV